MKIKQALTAALFGSYSLLFAAEVSDNVQLAPKQVLRIDLAAKPENVHPHYCRSMYECWIAEDLFEGLVTLDAKGKIVGGAAERWEANKDCTIWTFYLRPEAKWSNGDPVTAADFVYGMHTLLMSDSKLANYLGSVWKIQNADLVRKRVLPLSVLGIQALSKQTLQIKLASPDPFFPERCGLKIFPLHKDSGPSWDEAVDICLPKIRVTNGPYCQLVYFTNLKYQAERNPYYWDNARTAIDRVEYYFTEDVAVRQERFLQDKMDLTLVVGQASGSAEQYKTKFGNRFQRVSSTSQTALCINAEQKPFNNLKVRQAFNMVIDREALLKYLKQPQNLPIYSELHPNAVNQSLIEPEWVNWPYEKRVQEARKKLKGLRLPPIVLSCTIEASKAKLPAYLAQTWKETLGVEVRILEMDFQTLMQKERTKDFMMQLRGSVHMNPSFPWSFLGSFIKPASENYCCYYNPKLAGLLEKVLALGLTPEERENTLLEANCLMASEGPIFSLYYRTMDYLVQPYVGGINQNNLTGVFKTKYLYLIQHP